MEGCDRLVVSTLSSDLSIASSAGGVSLAISTVALELAIGNDSSCDCLFNLNDEVPLNFLSFGARLFFVPSL